jgi:hypothetical protein
MFHDVPQRWSHLTTGRYQEITMRHFYLARFFDRVWATGSIPVASFESLFSEGHTADFRTSVSAAKNPVPGAEKLGWRELHLEAVAAECALRLKSVNMKKWNQGRARPSRSNCSDHSAGASRNVAMPMPRGSRPSTAALTRAGAMNAIDIVMLT